MTGGNGHNAVEDHSSCVPDCTAARRDLTAPACLSSVCSASSSSVYTLYLTDLKFNKSDLSLVLLKPLSSKCGTWIKKKIATGFNIVDI